MDKLAAIAFALIATGCLDYKSLSNRDGGPDVVAEAPADFAGVDLAGSDIRPATDDMEIAAQPDGGSEEDGGEPPPDLSPAPELPATCAAINAALPASNDGNYTLYFQHDSAKPWVAYCKGMGPAGAALEYLTLPQGSANNQSAIGADLPASGEYVKIRIDPATLKVDITDKAYNIKTGSQNYGCTVGDVTTTTSIAYAYTRAYCGANHGTAKIDLRGTVFKVAQNAFTSTGSGSASATYSDGDQVVTLDASGPITTIAATGNKLQLIYP